MRYAIMSDVHANPKAFEQALADVRAQGCDRIVFLGDITGYGYDGLAAFDLVRANSDICILGNHDAACARVIDEADVLANPNYTIDVETRAALGPIRLNWLATLPYVWSPHVEEPLFACSHSTFVHPENFDYVFTLSDAAESLAQRPEQVLFVGHTHAAAVAVMQPDGSMSISDGWKFDLQPGCRYLINVGTVGYPRNDLETTYAILDDERRSVEIRELPFDFMGYAAANLARGRQLSPWLLEAMSATFPGPQKG